MQERKPLTPAQLEEFRKKGAQSRAGVNPGEEGSITELTSDQEINSRAARIAYNLAVPVHVIASNLFLERRVAQLESANRNSGKPIHLKKLERRA